MMHQITEYLELAALSWKITEDYLQEAEDKLHFALEELEDCLNLITELRQGELFWQDTKCFNTRKQHLVNYEVAPHRVSAFHKN